MQFAQNDGSNAAIVSRALIDHAETTGMTEDMSPSVLVFQFLLSLIDYCDANKVDLDAEVSNVRQHIAECGQ